MVQTAFQEKYWQSDRLVQVAADGAVRIVRHEDDDPTTEEFTLLQYNFALFFGLAVQLYEATLVSDNTPWDQFRRDHPIATDPKLNPWTNEKPNYISRFALFGAHLFNDRTGGPTNIRCSNCHESNELTDASVRRIGLALNGPVRNRAGNVIDKGFNNIGLRPTDNDLGVGASDEFGPLSHSKRLFTGALPATFDGAAVTKGFGVEGAFKVPSLRNVALTAPYFHNGDTHSLREAVLLYSRGGNVAPISQTDGTVIEPLGVPSLSSDEVDAIVAWLESLTDERVRIASAPFDHPQLFVPNGHPGNEGHVEYAAPGFAKDQMLEIPMTGTAGGPPLPGFLEGVFGPQ
jgi:cytochrome c peroxidase